MRRILIVDDEPAIREALAAALTDAGYTVEKAPSGRVALERIVAAPPDLVITDVMMPGLDGWALLDSIRKHTPTLPVVLMSARDPIPTRRAIADLDHTAFLAKPFDLEALLAIVTRWTDHHEA